ncbi:MAG: DUF58 domain-containing protein [Lachnospiraceae bacterium]|nr:DUF58 domain-containing protein [Lachnospiraceae bacterium]
MNKRKLLILIAVFALSLVGISLRGGPVPYVFFWLTLLVPAVCALYILFVMIFLKIYQRSDGRTMVCGTPTDFYITLNNESPFSFSSVRIKFYSSFSTVTGLDDGCVYELPPHSSLTRMTPLLCRYRGEYLVGIKEMIISDFLNLFSFRYRIKEPLSVIVAPANIRLETLRYLEEHPDADRDSLKDRPRPDIPVREYVAGDDTHLIHWKASAVMGKLMVRERTGTEKSGIAIIMEASRYSDKPEDYLPAENRVIESVLALAFYYMGNGVPVDVIYYSGRAVTVPVRTPGDYERLYEAMRGYFFGDEGNTVRLLDELQQEMCWQYSIIIPVLIRFSAREHDLIGRMNVAHVPVRVYLADDNADAAGETGGIEVIPVGTKAPTEDVL